MRIYKNISWKFEKKFRKISIIFFFKKYTENFGKNYFRDKEVHIEKNIGKKDFGKEFFCYFEVILQCFGKILKNFENFSDICEEF